MAIDAINEAIPLLKAHHVPQELLYAAKAWLECGGPVEEYKELYEAIR